MKDQDSPKNKPAKPENDKVSKDQSGVDQAAQSGADVTAQKDLPKAVDKPAQKKPGETVGKKPPSRERPPASTAAKKTDTTKQTEKKPPGAASKPAAPGQVEEKKGSAASLWIGSLALLLAILAALGVYQLYLQGQQQSAALEERLGELQSSLDGNQAKIAANLQRLTQLEALNQAVEAIRSEVDSAASVRQRIEAEQQALNTRMTEMAATLGRTTLAWRLAEVEYLLMVANTRLTLERDPHTALIALQTADQKLRAIGDPAFVPVRQAIADEVTALKAVAEPDITGMALSLASLAEAVDSLPLQNTQPARSAGPAVTSSKEDYQSLDWSAIPGAVWRDLRDLVVVRRVDKPIEPLLPPSEEWYLRQNLKLKLEQARLSLLRFETSLYHQLLDEAGDWLKAYFNTESAAVKGMLESLQQLKQADLQPSLPDVSESLRILRKHMESLGVAVEPVQRGGDEP